VHTCWPNVPPVTVPVGVDFPCKTVSLSFHGRLVFSNHCAYLRATTLTDADILNEVVLGTLAKSAKNTYSKIWKELEPTVRKDNTLSRLEQKNKQFASRFLYDQELLCDELPQYPPFYHEAFPAEHWSLLDEHLSDLVTSASFSEAEAQTYDKIRSDLQEIVAGMKGAFSYVAGYFTDADCSASRGAGIWLDSDRSWIQQRRP